MQDIELIALDLDGTLLRSDKTISVRNRAAIERAVRAGLRVVPASGRMHSSTRRYAEDLGLDPSWIIVSYNGALARSIDGARTILSRPLAADAAQYIVRFAQEHGRHLNYYLGDVLYTATHDRWTDLYYERTGSQARIVGDLDQFDGERPTKLIIIDEPGAIRDLAPAMTSHFGACAVVMVTDDEYLEFMAPDANKGTAIAAVAADIGIPRERCMAMGDNYNDLSMLEWAGRGVAMSNGRRSLLDSVPEHAPAADDDGVAVVIERLLSLRA